MFKRLQLKLTLLYTGILVGILVVSNVGIYLLMTQYNEAMLGREIEDMLASISSTEWLYGSEALEAPSTAPTDDDHDATEVEEKSTEVEEKSTKAKEETTEQQQEDSKDQEKRLEEEKKRLEEEQKRLEEQQKEQEKQQEEKQENDDSGKLLDSAVALATSPSATGQPTATDAVSPPITVDQLEIPRILDSFQYYILFTPEGQIAREKGDNTDIYERLKAEAAALQQYGEPKLIEVDTNLERYYLLAKLPIVIEGKTLGYSAVARDVSVAFETLRNLVSIQIIGTLLGTLVAVALGYYLAGRSIRPIQAAYASKQAFLANASHELKTPLSVIRLSAEALRGELAPGPTLNRDFLSQTVADIEDEALKMSGLVNHLMQLARSDDGQWLVKMESVALSELLTEELTRYSKVAEAKQISLQFELEPHVRIHADVALVKSLIGILTDNAIKYTHSGGQVLVTLTRGSGKRETAILKVRDSGIGIPREALDKIFERFYRVESSRSKETGGYGLGLSIAKEIVDQHDAKIEVNSIEGAGTEFIVTWRG